VDPQSRKRSSRSDTMPKPSWVLRSPRWGSSELIRGRIRPSRVRPMHTDSRGSRPPSRLPSTALSKIVEGERALKFCWPQPPAQALIEALGLIDPHLIGLSIAETRARDDPWPGPRSCCAKLAGEFRRTACSGLPMAPGPGARDGDHAGGSCCSEVDRSQQGPSRHGPAEPLLKHLQLLFRAGRSRDRPYSLVSCVDGLGSPISLGAVGARGWVGLLVTGLGSWTAPDQGSLSVSVAKARELGQRRLSGLRNLTFARDHPHRWRFTQIGRWAVSAYSISNWHSRWLVRDHLGGNCFLWGLRCRLRRTT
jgi:hypothetical protein